MRKNKTLGLLSCHSEDLKREINLGNMAFNRFQKIWKTSIVDEEIKISIYEATVVSLMMYNSSVWAVKKTYWKNLTLRIENIFE